MRLKIVQAGEEVLRQVARPLTIDEIRLPDFQTLVESMRETMRDAPGVGLAAPQIGLSIQLAVIEDRPEYSKDILPERLAERERHGGSISGAGESSYNRTLGAASRILRRLPQRDGFQRFGKAGTFRDRRVLGREWRPAPD
jgi:hypothetical protein